MPNEYRQGKRSLRSKIFSTLSKISKPSASENSVNENAVPFLLTTADPRHDASDSDSSSSVDDHLVSLEDIDLDSQFFSQGFSQPASEVAEKDTINPEVVPSENESDFDAEENDRVNLMLTQLASFEQTKQLWAESKNCHREVEPPHGSGRDEDIQKVICRAEGIENGNTEGTNIRTEASDGEWEQIGMYEPQNVDIIVSQPQTKCGKVIDVDAQLKRLLQSERRDKRLQLHSITLLCLLGRGFHLNKHINHLISNNSKEILCFLGAMVIRDFEVMDVRVLRTICGIYKKLIADNHANVYAWKFSNSKINMKDFNEWSTVLFVAIMRFLSIETRFVMHLNVPSKNIIPQKAKSEKNVNRTRKAAMKTKSQERYPNVPLTTAEILKRKPEFINFTRIPQIDGTDDSIPEKRSRFDHSTNGSKPNLWKLRLKKHERNLDSNKLSSLPSNQETTSLFFSQRSNVLGKKPKQKKGTTKPKPNVVKPLNIIVCWVEIFLSTEKRWVTVDVTSGEVDCLGELIESLQQPPVYVFAWNNDNSLKDVTPRYWWRNEMVSRRSRVDNKWLQPLIRHFGRQRKTIQDLVDELQFRLLRNQAPIPEKYSDFKNHPSYCLKRDLLKFQGIYPPDAPPLGFFHGEPIFARDCVRTLHSREVWLRHAKVIRMHEQPYKVVMSKLKREKTELELFGYWQTEEYIPPEPIDGRVPRNAYGNIEIFKECMLPKGTVHLKQANISRICRRLNVDYAPAVVGFGVHAGGNHPVFEGIVICQEFQQQVLEEYERDQIEQERRKHEKREKVIYDRWKKLIQGLLIRNRLRKKYNFGDY